MRTRLIVRPETREDWFSDFLFSDLSRFRLATLCSTVFVVATFALSYLLWGHDGLPIGWDTPVYITQSKIVASQGLSGLLSVQGPYDLLYQLVSGSLVRAGTSATNVEIFLPIALASLFPYLLGRLTLVHSDLRLATIVVIATPAWYAIYSIPAGLHANLLGLILMLTAMVLASGLRSIRDPKVLLGLILVGLASFAHIETTLFLVTIILISSLTAKPPFSTRVALLFVGVATPAAIAFTSHFFQLLGLTGGTIPYRPSESVWFWLTIFGPLLPLCAIGIYTSIRRRVSSLEILVAIWALASVVTGASQYLVPQTYIFAQRAAILVPVPFLAAIGLRWLQSQVVGSKVHGESTRSLARWIQVAALVLLAVSWPVTYVEGASLDQKVFLNSSTYARLEWIHNNLQFSTPPIFIYNDMDQAAGALADFYDNWVWAIIGTHLSYLGHVDYLVQLQETPYSNIISREISARFMKQMRDTMVTDRTALFEHQLVLVEDFYNPPPLPTYVSDLFTKVSDGVFIANNTSLNALVGITLPMYSSYASAVGPWNTAGRSWAQSGFALETQVNSPPVNIQATYLLASGASGTYTVSLRYWDLTGSGLSIMLDSSAVGSIQYNNTMGAVLGNFTVILSQGVHSLTIEVNQETGVQQYASLDYLVLIES